MKNRKFWISIFALFILIVGCGRLWVGSSSSSIEPISYTISLVGNNTISTNACRLLMVKAMSGATVIQAPTSATISLSGAGAGAYYSDVTCATPVTAVTLASGTKSKLFYYKNPSAQSVTLAAAAAGGNTSTLAVTTSAGAVAWTQKFPAASPPALMGAPMIFHTLRNSMIIYGGDTAGATFGTVSSQMWEYNGTTWTMLCGPCSPGAKFMPGLAYDIERDKVVLFGGGATAAGSTNDIWEWDGTTWTLRTGLGGTAPSARANVFSGYDSIRKRVIIFGGLNTASVVNSQLFEYDGSSWYGPFSPATRPANMGSQSNAAAFDSVNGNWLIYGGENAAFMAITNEVWAWNGTAWTQKSGTGMSVTSTGNFLAFDNARNRLVIAQGYDNGGDINGTREHDGTTFAITNPNGDPASSRDGGGAAYNGFTGKMVIFGGNSGGGGGNFAETWEYGPP